MMATAMSYVVEFSNATPDAVEVRRLPSLDVNGTDVPADAMQFSLFGEDRVWIGPAYFVTNDVEFGPIDLMRQRYPHAMLHEPSGDFDRSVPYGLVTWDNRAGPQWMGSMLVPVIDGVSEIYDRNRRLVVPTSGS